MDHLYILSDSAGYHGTQQNFQVYNAYRLRLLDTPPTSLDHNAIKNAWNTLKFRLWKQFSDRERHPHSEDELIQAAQDEWETIL
jgi:hypothetical protein